ncbi:MAG: hypothetical protein ACLR56_06860 [Oscillospiraceae bacterium]
MLGGATFDACMLLNEDPWERLRTLKKHMPTLSCKCFRNKTRSATSIVPMTLLICC